MDVSSITIPTPVGGLNLLDAIDSMPPQDLIDSENVYSDLTTVSVRNGQTLFGSTGLSGTGVNLIPFTSSAAAAQLFHHESGATLVNITSGVASNIAMPNTLTAAMNWCSFNNRLFMFDGSNNPCVYDPGAGTVSNVGFTGVTGGNSTLIAAGSFKNTICLIQTGTATMYYAAPAAITGATSAFDFSPFFKKGGSLRYVGSWTNQVASTSQEIFVAISSEGEILCYSGDAPNASLSNFSLVARYPIGKPLGYKAFVQLDNDLWVITDQGIVSLQSLFNQGLDAALAGMPAKINAFIRQYALSIGVSSRWLGTYWPAGQRVYIHVPISSSQTVLLVCNTRSGAWSKYTFVENSKVAGTAVYNSRIYGVNLAGRVCQLETASDDDGVSIPWTMKWAWSFANSRGRFKKFIDVRPIVYCFAGQQLQVGVATDFQNNAALSTIEIGTPQSATTDAEWDTTDWDTTDWADEPAYFANWHAISGQGQAVSLQMSGTASTQITFNSIDLRFEVGSQR